MTSNQSFYQKNKGILLAVLLLVSGILGYIQLSVYKAKVAKTYVIKNKDTIDSLKSETKELEKTRAIEVKTIEVESGETIKMLRDSIALLMAKESSLQRPTAITKFNVESNSTPKLELHVDTSTGDFVYNDKWLNLKGRYSLNKVMFDSGGIRFNTDITIVSGQKRKNIFSSWYTVSQIASSSPYMNISNVKSVSLKNKIRRFRGYIGAGMVYDFQNNRIVVGPSAGIGFTF